MVNFLENTSEPWGSYKTNLRQKILFLLVKFGCSHGVIKELVQTLWYINGEKYPSDVIHQSVKFRLYPWDNVKDRKILFGSAVQDAMELDFLKKRLSKNSIVIDIGANIGYYSCILASSGLERIIAVEPHPETLRRLMFNININNFNKSVQVAPYALGDIHKEVFLNETVGSKGSSSILLHHHEDSKQQFKVQMIPLYELCNIYIISHIDAIKIDVEGVEDMVLMPFFKIAPQSLWPECMVIEHGHSKDWQSDLFAYFAKNGYIVQRKNRSNTILTFNN